MASSMEHFMLIMRKSVNERKRQPIGLFCQCLCPLVFGGLLTLLFNVVPYTTFGYTIATASKPSSTTGTVSLHTEVPFGTRFLALAKLRNVK